MGRKESNQTKIKHSQMSLSVGWIVKIGSQKWTDFDRCIEKNNLAFPDSKYTQFSP